MNSFLTVKFKYSLSLNGQNKEKAIFASNDKLCNAAVQLKISQPVLCRIIKSRVQIVKDDKNSDNRINQSNSVIGIKLRMAQSDPIKRRPL